MHALLRARIPRQPLLTPSVPSERPFPPTHSLTLAQGPGHRHGCPTLYTRVATHVHKSYLWGLRSNSYDYYDRKPNRTFKDQIIPAATIGRQGLKRSDEFICRHRARERERERGSNFHLWSLIDLLRLIFARVAPSCND